MNRLFLAFLTIVFTVSSLFAQADSISSHRPLWIKAILPTTFIVTGSLLSGGQLEQDVKLNVRQRLGEDYHFRIDDYLQFSPIGELYLADLLHIKAKNHWFDQSKNLFFTLALNQIVINSLKSGLNKTRPDGGNHSFPSGHTAFAFANATVLYEEFIDTHPLLAYSGYGIAVTTGTFRILNNRHWLSDVITGAGIGILSARLIYHLEPLKKWNPFRDKTTITFRPIITPIQYSFHAQMNF